MAKFKVDYYPHKHDHVINISGEAAKLFQEFELRDVVYPCNISPYIINPHERITARLDLILPGFFSLPGSRAHAHWTVSLFVVYAAPYMAQKSLGFCARAPPFLFRVQNPTR